MKAVLKTIWENRKGILEGIKNSVIRDEFVEDIARMRHDICEKCEYIDLKGKQCAVKGTKPCCADCGCSLAFKTRSLSSECPQGKWDAIATEEEEDELDNLKD
jgi:hypothetical protein